MTKEKRRQESKGELHQHLKIKKKEWSKESKKKEEMNTYVHINK